jgi:hypothetical protein
MAKKITKQNNATPVEAKKDPKQADPAEVLAETQAEAAPAEKPTGVEPTAEAAPAEKPEGPVPHVARRDRRGVAY